MVFNAATRSAMASALAAAGLALSGPALASAPTIPTPNPFEIMFSCGPQVFILKAVKGDGGAVTLGLESGATQVPMRQTQAASGARFEAQGDASTWIWLKGNRATASLGGRELPECWAKRLDDPGDDIGDASVAC